MATQLDAETVTTEQENAVETNEAPKLVNSEQFDQIDKLFEEAQAEHLVPAEQKAEDKTQSTDANAQVNAQIEAVGLIDDPAKHKVKVKLEGQEAEIPLSEVLAGYQKNEVASRRLNEATRIKAEAEALLAKAKTANTDTTGDKENADTAKTVDENAIKIAKNAINSILDGNEEEAAMALAQLTAGRGNSTQSQNVDPTEIATAVKQQLDVESALNEFSTTYQDVLADPHLARMTNEALTAELQSGNHADYASALKAAGDATRNWMQKMGIGAKADEVTTTSNERVARKQAVEQTPQVNASAAYKAEAEESPLSIVEEMKKQRGFIA